MKKALLLVTILFISVVSTACINNFAVQELNNKAKEFMDKGDYSSAIERLKSSVDLDGTIFETQYNLAVAYTQAEDYANAIKTYNDAINLKPDFADSYYSRAVCEENLAKDILAGKVKVNEDGSISKIDESEIPEENSNKKEITENDKNSLVELLNNSIADYQIYIDKANSQQDKETVENKVEELKKLVEENSIK